MPDGGSKRAIAKSSISLLGQHGPRRPLVPESIPLYRSTALISSGNATRFPTSPPIMVRLTSVPK